MSEHPKGHDPVQRGYEDSSVSVKQLFAFAMGIVALVLVGVLVSSFTFKFFVNHTPMGPSASPFEKEDARDMPPDLRLQTHAPLDLKQYRDNQDTILTGYGWVDPKAGVVRIPVERAMELLLQKGYPSRGSSPADGRAAKTPKAAATHAQPAPARVKEKQ